MTVKACLVFSFFFLLLIIGCQTPKTIKFEPGSSDTSGIDVSLVEFGKTNGHGEKLGKIPLTVDLASLNGRVIKLSGPGYDDQFWVMADQLGEENTVRVQLKQRQFEEEHSEKQAKASLLLLKAYKALLEQKLDLAQRLAAESKQILKLGPGAMIIQAIATWQSGDRARAQTMIEEAKALYPRIPELDELLNAVKGN